MELEVREQGGVKIMRLVGDLVGDHSGDFVQAITDELTGPGKRLALDLSAITFMNSTGLSELVRVNAQANLQECRLVLAAPTAFVMGVLQMTRLDRFFEVFPSVADALAALK